jgi:hypothetical protein
MTDEDKATLLVALWGVGFALAVIGLGAWMITR